MNNIIKNLRINRQRVAALIGAVILTPMLSGCSLSLTGETNNSKETYVSEDSVLNNKGIQYLVINGEDNQKIVPIESLKLVNSKNEVIEKIDSVIVGGKIMDVKNPVDIMFSDDIQEVIIGYDILPVSEFALINGETGEKITNVAGAYVNNEFVDLSNNTVLNGNKVLTDEEFYKLVDAKVEECEQKGIAFDKEDVETLAMATNINELVEDNLDLLHKIAGVENPTPEELDNLMQNGEKIQDTFNDYNLESFRTTGNTDDYILISDLIFDEEERAKAELVEKKVNEIGSYARVDVDKMNDLITPFFESFYDSTQDVYNMESGTCYGLRYILRPIRDLYGKNECEDKVTLNKENLHLIKYFVSYMEDEYEYYINGWGTAAYQNVYGILNDNCKTLTKTK